MRKIGRDAFLLWVLLGSAALAGPGFRYAETMPGYLTPGRDDHRRSASSVPAVLRVEGLVDDFEAFMADPDHPMRLVGTLGIRGADGVEREYPVEDGRLRFLAPGEGERTRYTRYDFAIRKASGAPVHVHGFKRIHDDPGFDMSRDLLDLNVSLHRGGPGGPVEASGVLRVEAEKPWVLARFVGSFRVPGARSWRERLAVLHRYGKLYFGALWRVYRGKPGSPGREKAPRARKPGA